jgi:ElaB/YqjD/DUF883 family membrane-anchored ribosome-binding protein
MEIKEAAEKLKNNASSTIEEKATGGAENTKSFVSNKLRQFSRVLQSGSEQLKDQEKENEISRYFVKFSDRLNQMADSIDQRSVKDFYERAAEYSRKNPIAIAAIATAVGFVLTRVTKEGRKAA